MTFQQGMKRELHYQGQQQSLFWWLLEPEYMDIIKRLSSFAPKLV
jgi:hypothetical protein